jgi:hypothetical protein
MTRSVRVDDDEFYSVVESVEKEELLEVLHEEMVMSEAEAHAAALAVAHGEDTSEWIAAIGEQLTKVGTAIELQALLKLVQLPLIELWLGLLLGAYGMRREVEEFEQDEDFYSTIGIVVALV